MIQKSSQYFTLWIQNGAKKSSTVQKTFCPVHILSYALYLAPSHADHQLTKTFYLDFQGLFNPEGVYSGY